MQSIRGMRDIWPPEAYSFAWLVNTASELVESFGYSYILTPIIEPRELFVRALGDATDVVQKEMYEFVDKGNRHVVLRPEATASVLRAFFQRPQQERVLPSRLYTYGPMFRFDRPQSGRYRQFYQFDVELLGDASAYADVEIIELAVSCLRSIGIDDFQLQLNSIGDENCRPRYKKALVEFYAEHEAELCEDCKKRLYTNPLRLLDCKESSCELLKQSAPRIDDFLCDECKEHYELVKQGLLEAGINYVPNPFIVRGLDYYSRTTFEFWHHFLGESQNSLGGGGRYDGLASQLGFGELAATGFAVGIDRILVVLEKKGLLTTLSEVIYILPTDRSMYTDAASLARKLRQQGIKCAVDYTDRSLSAKFKAASRAGATRVVIVGPKDVANGVYVVRHLDKSTQYRVSISEVAENLLVTNT